MPRRISLLPALRRGQPQAPVPEQYLPRLDRDRVVRRPRVGHAQGCTALVRRHRAMTRSTVIALLLRRVIRFVIVVAVVFEIIWSLEPRNIS